MVQSSNNNRPLCKNKVRNARRMEEAHGMDILRYKEIWEAIKELYHYGTKKQKGKNPIMKGKREVVLDRLTPFLQEVKKNGG